MFGAGAAAGAKQVATFPRPRSETASLMALRAAIDLGELLAIFGAFAPTAGLARFVTRRAFALRFREIVDVDDLGAGARDDLFPVDGLHVAQVVVVEQAATTGQYVCA